MDRRQRHERTSSTTWADVGGCCDSWFTRQYARRALGLLDKLKGIVQRAAFFDVAGRSQFIGTADRPDILLDAANQADNQTLNNSPNGFYNALGGLGRILKLKVYGPLQPGLLSTVEVTATTVDHRPVTRTVQLQLGSVTIPAVRAAVQVGQNLGAMQPGGESPVMVHWGDQRVLGDLAVQRVEDLVFKSTAAPVTGQPYDQMLYAQDRWTEYWIGGTVSVISPPLGQSANPPLPENVHLHQDPTPGVRLDRWDYDALTRSRCAGGLFIDSTYGQIHPQGGLGLGSGNHACRRPGSQAIGDLVDWSSSTQPMGNRRVSIIGTWCWIRTILKAFWSCRSYVLRPRAVGTSVPVLSPSPPGPQSLGTRFRAIVRPSRQRPAVCGGYDQD